VAVEDTAVIAAVRAVAEDADVPEAAMADAATVALPI
jgi:hypothetical protein